MAGFSIKLMPLRSFFIFIFIFLRESVGRAREALNPSVKKSNSVATESIINQLEYMPTRISINSSG